MAITPNSYVPVSIINQIWMYPHMMVSDSIYEYIYFYISATAVTSPCSYEICPCGSNICRQGLFYEHTFTVLFVSESPKLHFCSKLTLLMMS